MFYVVVLLVVFLVGNGVAMVAAPEVWYHSIPAAMDSGPLNLHFARDIGIVYIISGVGILWRLFDPLRAWPFVLAGAFFLTAHAIFHLIELAFGDHHSAFYLNDLFTIYLPAALACWLARPTFIPLPALVRNFATDIAHRQIDKFARAFDYDAGYMHEIADASLESIARFAAQETFASYREGVPAAAWYAAKLIGCLSEDCGPCTQLLVRMAQAEGVDDSTLEAVVTNAPEGLDDDIAMVVQYAKAVVAHEPQAYDWQRKIAARWGRTGLISLAFALTSGRVFPQIKYAMGHGKTCSNVRIGGHETIAGNYRGLVCS